MYNVHSPSTFFLFKLVFQGLPYVKSKRNVTDRYAVGSLEDFEGYCIDILREITKITGWLTYFDYKKSNG